MLHLPNSKERFHLYSDSSRVAMDNVLYQIENGKPKLKAYASKILPKQQETFLLQS